MSLRTLTVRQPWASLIAAGVKTIETRSWSTKHRGRIAIHAGAFVPVEGEEYGTGWWWCQHSDHGGEIVEQASMRSAWAPLGAIVATAELVDVVPTNSWIGWHKPPERLDGQPQPAEYHGWLSPGPSWRWILVADDDPEPSLFIAEAEQVLDDYSPGRYAWLLDDIKPTTERCPWCWGVSRVDRAIPGVPREVCQASSPCPVCWPRNPAGELAVWNDASAGRCDPIPAKVRQGLWSWTP